MGRRPHGRLVTLMTTAFSHILPVPGIHMDDLPSHVPPSRANAVIHQTAFPLDKMSGREGDSLTSNPEVDILSPFPVQGSGLQGFACPGLGPDLRSASAPPV